MVQDAVTRQPVSPRHSHVNGNLLGKSTELRIFETTMARKIKRSESDGAAFPASLYWEELASSWERDRADHLGPDHIGRFETVALQLKSLAPGEQLRRGYVSRATIAEMVSALDVADPDLLVDRLYEIAGRHLRPVHRLLLGSDSKTTRSQLNVISRAAQSLEEMIEALAPVTAHYLDEFSEQLPAGKKGKRRQKIGDVSQTLADLAVLCARASNELVGLPHRPTKSLREQTLLNVVAAVESGTNKLVNTRWGRDDKKCFEFKDREGEFVREFMRMVEPGASEAALVKLLQKAKSEIKKARTPQ